MGRYKWQYDEIYVNFLSISEALGTHWPIRKSFVRRFQVLGSAFGHMNMPAQYVPQFQNSPKASTLSGIDLADAKNAQGVASTKH